MQEALQSSLVASKASAEKVQSELEKTMETFACEKVSCMKSSLH